MEHDQEVQALSIAYTFDDLNAMAAYIESKAIELRQSAPFQKTHKMANQMNSEAVGLERAAHIVRNAKFEHSLRT